jgi:predicted enzyme related to lactoylglutathione lyase
MPNIDKHNNGDFCWFELGTTDQNGAKEFYSKLFGWSVNDFPMGPDGVYTTFQLQGRNTAAAYTLMKEQSAQGVPPHWGVYVQVASADDTAAKASQLGGTVLAPPFDVFDFGRMTAIRDPQSAVISAWQPKTHQGTGIGGVHGSVCWSELLTKDVAAAKQFYSGLFGWEMKVSRSGDFYTELGNAGRSIGGLMGIRPDMGPIPPNWGIYFLVDDIQKAVAKVGELGGAVVHPITDIPNVGPFAMVRDPQGAVFSLIKPQMM